MKNEVRSQSHQDSGLLLSEMINRFPGIVYQMSVGANGEIEFYYVSPRSEQIIGLKPQLEGYFERFIALVVPEHRDDFTESLIKSVKDSGEWNFEGMLHKPSGEKIWFSCEFTLTDRGDEIIYNGIIQDITKRRILEENLRRREEKKNVMLANISDVIGIIDLDGFIKYKSPNIEKWFGWHPDDLIGTDGWLTVHPDDLEYVKEGFYTILEKDKSTINVEYRYKCKDGTYKWIELTATNLVNNPVIGGVLFSYHNITDRKLAEKERLAVTLRSIGDGVIATDLKGKIVFINKMAEELTGWKIVEAQGKSISSVFNLIDEKSRNTRDNPVEKVLTTGQITELADHTLLVSLDGTERLIADSCAPIMDEERNLFGVVLVFRDITEKQRLIKTSHKVQKLESLGVLAGGIAHDFNNLMGGIFGCIELADKHAVNNNVKEYLSKAMNTIDRARDLTRELLTFSAGGTPVIEINYLFPFVKEIALRTLKGTNVLCQFNIQKNLWACSFDKKQIGLVFKNLIINAQQAMPTGGSIEFSACNITLEEKENPLLAKGNYVRISVKDTGIGIPKEMFSRIFDPFFTTKTQGQGLGLAVCYSIINRHGGFIDIESEPGKGSTFLIFLPASKGFAAEGAKG